MASPVHPGESALFLGIDIGTSGVRAITIDASGEEVAAANTPLPPPVQRGHCVEQDPELWWQAVCQTLDKLAQKCRLTNVKALCIDGTSGTVFLADENEHPLHPALMYNDARAENELERLKHIAPADSPTLSPSSGLAKLLWLSKQDYADKARYIYHQADWITSRLSGRPGISDENNTLKTGYDSIEKAWPDWLNKLQLGLTYLPEVARPGTDAGKIDPDIAKRFGLAAACRILLGTTDSTASVIATGAKQPGDAITALGSTLVLKVISEQPVFSAEHGIYSQPYGDYWLCGGASNSGGAVLRQFFTDQQMAGMQASLIARVQAGKASGLDYYPLSQPGERFPVNDPRLQPAIEPRPDDDVVFFHGLLEGITHIETRGYELLHKLGAPRIRQVFTTGGGSVNDAWTQMRANMLKVPVVKATHHQAAYGVACLAMSGHDKQI